MLEAPTFLLNRPIGEVSFMPHYPHRYAERWERGGTFYPSGQFLYDGPSENPPKPPDVSRGNGMQVRRVLGGVRPVQGWRIQRKGVSSAPSHPLVLCFLLSVWIASVSSSATKRTKQSRRGTRHQAPLSTTQPNYYPQDPATISRLSHSRVRPY